LHFFESARRTGSTPKTPIAGNFQPA
jgi:hypothetical protein